MEGVVTLIETSSHFSMSSVDSRAHLSKSHATTTTASTTTTTSTTAITTATTLSTRKRKPIVTFQSPDSGVLDMALLIRNTALEFEAAAALAAASRSNNRHNNNNNNHNHNHNHTSRVSGSSTSSASSSSTSSPLHTTTTLSYAPTSASSGTSTTSTNGVYTPRQLIPSLPPLPPSSSFRPITLIPRAPHPLYHPLSHQQHPTTTSNHSGLKSKNNEGKHGDSSSITARSPDTGGGGGGRRSSSRTRRPAPKMRETERESGPENSLKDIPEAAGDHHPHHQNNKSATPAKRRRGGVGNNSTTNSGGKRRRGGAGAGGGGGEVDGDSAYPATTKRSRKQPQRDKNEMMDVDGDVPSQNNNNNDTSPPSGYSTRARRPRTAAPTVMKDDSGSEGGTASVARTTPVNGNGNGGNGNGAVDEFWVPTKAS